MVDEELEVTTVVMLKDPVTRLEFYNSRVEFSVDWVIITNDTSTNYFKKERVDAIHQYH